MLAYLRQPVETSTYRITSLRAERVTHFYTRAKKRALYVGYVTGKFEHFLTLSFVEWLPQPAKQGEKYSTPFLVSQTGRCTLVEHPQYSVQALSRALSEKNINMCTRMLKFFFSLTLKNICKLIVYVICNSIEHNKDTYHVFVQDC